jgi:hypothetical protein
VYSDTSVSSGRKNFMLPCLSLGTDGTNPVFSRLSEESFGAAAVDRVLGWSIIGLLRVEVELGMWRMEGRRAVSSLRRPGPFIESLERRDGLLDRNRRGR